MEGAVQSGVAHHNAANEHRIFFFYVVAVTPSRFRPTTVLGDYTCEHPQSHNLSKIIEIKNELLEMSGNDDGASGGDGAGQKRKRPRSRVAERTEACVRLQNAVNSLIDSSKSTNKHEEVPGVRQLLEKKEGLFRKNMMGKRVNYAARSVISPDPYIGTDEIGVPVRFAKKLTYRQPVTPWNVEQLREAVINGVNRYPGAHKVEDEHGVMVDLTKRNRRQRAALAKTLLTRPAVQRPRARRWVAAGRSSAAG